MMENKNYSIEDQYQRLVAKFEMNLKQLYLNYIFSKYGLKIGDFIKVTDKNKVSYYYIEDIEFRGPNLSLQGRAHSSPYFRLKLTPVDEQGNVLWIDTGASIYEDYKNVSKVNMHFSGKKIDCLGNVLLYNKDI